MISEKAVTEALSRGIITRVQAESLKSIEAELAASRLDAPDEEKLRFITGFGDVFVAIGLVLFLSAIRYFGNLLAEPYAGGWIAVAAASWLLAEFFTRRRRMALPSILLLLAFCGAIFLATTSVIAPHTETSMFDPSTGIAFIAGGALTALGALLHYARFHVPITIAAGAAGLVAIFAGILFAVGDGSLVILLQPLLFLCGVAIFAAAMRFDMVDPLRQTRRTDIAFWLHLLAAPLIVHSVLSRMMSSDTLTSTTAFAILAVFIVLASVAVLVNRRAILVAGLSYTGFAFGTLIREAGFSSIAAPLTLLALGALVLLLSAGWNFLRSRILRAVPEGWRTKLPPDLSPAT
ncbi:hypothetical protein IZ6_00620 [Terrihabitans soli]|uniref:DUF2157 domain-containing protein n=1 Tax=Terrihabitans soli TaxID=708113 RepID=A0A6S6QN32_9HYPH|nr:hypothetical protein [Terrihabitans soli]BCJ89327.1 hypothetical protein IZ6_00620 [Terrihabitans soli]